MTEVLVLSLAGASLGLLLAGAASGAFRVLAKGLPRIDEIGLDWRIVLYTLGSALADGRGDGSCFWRRHSSRDGFILVRIVRA